MSKEQGADDLRLGCLLALGYLVVGWAAWIVIPLVVLYPIVWGLDLFCDRWPKFPLVCHVSEEACDPYDDPRCPGGDEFNSAWPH